MPSRAKFSTKTKKAILERDRYCIFCGGEAIDAHHVYFGTDSNYGDNRNDIDQGVSVCYKDHLEIHSCSKGKGKRQEAIEYLKNYYEQNREIESI